MIRRVDIAAAVLLASFVVVRAAPQATAPQTSGDEEAAGITLIQSVCGGCHTSGSILGQHRARQNWEEILDWMTDEGAVMTDDEYERMMAFLGIRYGLVAVNTAPLEEVRAVLELSADQARRVIEARTAGTTFTSVDDLAKTTGIPVAALSERQNRVDFSTVP